MEFKNGSSAQFYHGLAKQLLESYLSRWDRREGPLVTEGQTPGLFKKLPQIGKGVEGLREFLSSYLEQSINTNHPGFMNQLWSQTETESVMAEWVTAMTNTSMYTYEVAPLATEMELALVRKLTALLWGHEGEGVMTSGGTASNLQALLTARNVRLDQSKTKGLVNQELYVLASEEAHYSVKRSLNILGLGSDHLIEIEAKTSGEMDIDDLELQIRNLQNQKKQILAIVATAGTTVKGAYDPIRPIADLCSSSNIWLHVDGAYGASVALSAQHNELLEGIVRADSVAWDFHKMLGLNLPCAFLFMKEKGLLKRALSSGNDDYLFHDEDNIDLGPMSLQCGRRADVIKLFATWVSKGDEGFSQRINQLFDLSRYAALKIKESSKLQLVTEPQSINVCCRVEGGKEVFVREHLKNTNQYLVNYASDKEGPFLRLVFSNPYWKHEDVDRFILSIEEALKVSHEN